MPPQNLRAVGDRIEQLLDELHAVADPRGRAVAEELLRLVTELYGGGLERVVQLASSEAPEFAARLFEDDLVASLLMVHGLHPEPVATRVERALESVRPLLTQPGGDVELLDVDTEAGAVRLRLLGGDGCGSATLRLAIEGAIVDAAPEVVTVDIEHAAPRPPAVPVSIGRKAANG